MKKSRFRVVALLAVYNEELYLERCLRHLKSQGVESYVIDNGSTDTTRAIAESFLGSGVIAVEEYPNPGYYDWVGLLKRKEELAGTLDADWFIHHDADEIRLAPIGWGSLKQAFARLDRQGYNAVNFHEFTFLPKPGEDFRGTNYHKTMRDYYFFLPGENELRRVNGWKKQPAVDLKETGGHRVNFPGIRIPTKTFLLKHYIALSYEHLKKKYLTRVYSPYEVNTLGWHGNRVAFQNHPTTDFDRSSMLRAGVFTKALSTKQPLKRHLFDL